MREHPKRHGHLAAWRELNRRVAADLKAGTGDIHPVKVLHKRPHPLKTLIGQFEARVLRARFGKPK